MGLSTTPRRSVGYICTPTGIQYSQQTSTSIHLPLTESMHQAKKTRMMELNSSKNPAADTDMESNIMSCWLKEVEEEDVDQPTKEREMDGEWTKDDLNDSVFGFCSGNQYVFVISVYQCTSRKTAHLGPSSSAQQDSKKRSENPGTPSARCWYQIRSDVAAFSGQTVPSTAYKKHASNVVIIYAAWEKEKAKWTHCCSERKKYHRTGGERLNSLMLTCQWKWKWRFSDEALQPMERHV